MDILEAQKAIHDMAQDKGWWDLPEQLQRLVEVDHETAKWVQTHLIGTKLMLVVTELAEAFEELRDSHPANHIYFVGEKPEGFPIEIADATIRLLDLAGRVGLNHGADIELKVAYNATRAFRHGGKEA